MDSGFTAIFKFYLVHFKMDARTKPACKFGKKCYRKNPKHFKIFSHPVQTTGQAENDSSIKNSLRKNKELEKMTVEKKIKNDSIENKCEVDVNNIADKSFKNLENFEDKNEVLGIANESSMDTNLKDKSKEEIIKTLFLVDMPPDFYSFFEFYTSVVVINHKEAFQVSKLKLVGPFDILSEKIENLSNQDLFLCHWRFYYDPPEFQTVLAADSGYHIGYWRDDPKESPVFLASNNPNEGCIFKLEAENIFGCVYHYLNELIKHSDPFNKLKITKLQTALSNWAKKNNFPLEKKSDRINERQKKVVSQTFHTLGIVVPVDAKTEVGYRPLIETNANLKKICDLIIKGDDDDERESLWENLQPLINAANIANDECDFGNSLELGIDLFCIGSPLFHETVEHLLCTAYSLLERTEFEKIIKVHLHLRRKGNDLSVLKHQ